MAASGASSARSTMDRPRVEGDQPREPDRGDDDHHERDGEQRRPPDPAAQVGDPAGPEPRADPGDPGRERAARHDEDEDPGPGRRPGLRVERREREHDDAGVAHDRVAEDVLEVVLDEGGDGREDDRRDRDAERRTRAPSSRSTRSGVTDASVQARATTASEARRHRGQDRQGGLRDDVGQAGRPEMERDGPEAHRDRHREGEVGEPEDDRLGGELAEVAPEPGRRGDGQRPGDDDRARLADADRRPGPAVARDERHQDPEQAAGGRHEDRARARSTRPRVSPQAARMARVTAGASGASRRRARHREAEPDQRAEHEEQPQVGRRREPAAADLDDLRRVDRERGDERHRRAR